MSSFSKCTLDDSWFFYACVQRRSSCTSRWPISESWVIFLRILNCSNLDGVIILSRDVDLRVLQLAIFEPWALVFVIRRGLVRSVAWVGSLAEGTWSLWTRSTSLTAFSTTFCWRNDDHIPRSMLLSMWYDPVFFFLSNMYTAVAASNFYWLEKRVYFLAVVELVRMTASSFFLFSEPCEKKDSKLRSRRRFCIRLGSRFPNATWC